MKSERSENPESTVQQPATWRARVARVLERMFSHRRFPLILAVLGVVLTLPSLGVGWIADDHYQRARMADADFFPGLSGQPWRFFDFAGREPMAWAIEIGAWPWWTYPDLRAAFWRPLTVATHWVDYQLWPDHAIIMHAHSLAWWAVLIVCVTVMYRRLAGGLWVAGLAALFYAIDDARGMPVGFLANRNAIISTVFGVLAIIYHDRWRRDESKIGAWLAPACLLAALLSAEAGVGALAYLVAYSVFLDRAAIARRMASLLPSLAVVAGWRIAWSLLGYGVSGVGLYVDPLREPMRFLEEAVTKAPALLLGQWAFAPSALYFLVLDLGLLSAYMAVASIILIVLAGALAPLVRASRTAKFWALGMVLSLVPICAPFPADRLLFFVGLGAFGLLSMFLGGTASHERWSEPLLRRRPSRLAIKVIGVAMIAVHGCLAPLTLLLRSGMPAGLPSLWERLHVQTPMGDEVAGQSVVIVTAPVPLLACYLPVRRAFEGQAIPAHTRVLAPHDDRIEIDRVDDRTLAIRPRRGFLYLAIDRLARNGEHPFAVGDRVILPDMVAEITALTDDDRPSEVRFHFKEPLESEVHRWLYWTGHTYAPFALPSVGECIVLFHGARTGTDAQVAGR